MFVEVCAKVVHRGNDLCLSIGSSDFFFRRQLHVLNKSREHARVVAEPSHRHDQNRETHPKHQRTSARRVNSCFVSTLRNSTWALAYSCKLIWSWWAPL